MGNGVLNDHSLNLFRVSQSHAETDGPPVVLHEECVAIQMQLLRKVLHDFSERIEGIGLALVSLLAPARIVMDIFPGD